jgi:hypothetical protein
MTPTSLTLLDVEYCSTISNLFWKSVLKANKGLYDSFFRIKFTVERWTDYHEKLFLSEKFDCSEQKSCDRDSCQ